jgi:hypothetical protein
MIVCDEGEVKNCLIDEFEENVDWRFNWGGYKNAGVLHVLKFIDTKEQSDKSKWIEAVDVEHTRMVKKRNGFP